MISRCETRGRREKKQNIQHIISMIQDGDTSDKGQKMKMMRDEYAYDDGYSDCSDEEEEQ